MHTAMAQHPSEVATKPTHSPIILKQSSRFSPFKCKKCGRQKTKRQQSFILALVYLCGAAFVLSLKLVQPASGLIEIAATLLIMMSLIIIMRTVVLDRQCLRCGYDGSDLIITARVQPDHTPTAIESTVSAPPTHVPLIKAKREVSVTPPQVQVVHGVEINDDFRRVLGLLESNISSLYITGKAGTGKSTLLRYFVENTQKKVVVLAPTGIAAINVGGQTIHSFFRFPARILTSADIVNSRNKALYQAIDTFIVDEVSMVRADMIDSIDQFLRKNGRHPLKLFGGAQMIFFGDLYQLPPVVPPTDREYLSMRGYSSEFFFDANAFKALPVTVAELEKVYRQKSQDFIELLNAVRVGEMSSAQLDMLNSRCLPNLVPTAEEAVITLTTKNDQAFQMNSMMLERITSQSYAYTGVLEGEFPRDGKNLPVEAELILKVGAQVMFVKNDPASRWVNGTLGRVHRLTPNSVEVAIQTTTGTEIFPVYRERWDTIHYELDYEKQEIIPTVVGSYIQYPLRLAWAITIHKSQGATFDRVVIDLGQGAFADGQTYVALSRCRSLQGIVLRRSVSLADIRSNMRAHRFMENAVRH
jgi:ATP-dependent exoDNAse (exonuclease V) alpha subunit